MKTFAAILALCLAFVSLACGDGGSTASEQELGPAVDAPSDPPFATISSEEGERPTIDPPNLPAPKKARFRDLELGSGAAAKRGDVVGVHYIGFEYETGEQRYPGRWPPYPPQTFRLGSGGNGGPFEKGIEGMRTGGLRELIVPPGSLYGPGGTDYVISLVQIEPDSEKSPGQ
jgi:peptidylprolyl isomerase